MALEGRGCQERVSGGDERREHQEDTRSELELGGGVGGRGGCREGIGSKLDVGMALGGRGARQESIWRGWKREWRWNDEEGVRSESAVGRSEEA